MAATPNMLQSIQQPTVQQSTSLLDLLQQGLQTMRTKYAAAQDPAQNPPLMPAAAQAIQNYIQQLQQAPATGFNPAPAVMRKPVDAMEIASQGVPTAGAQSLAPADLKSLLNDVINSRASVFHNTTTDKAESILNSGNILSNSAHGGDAGVSVSRVPSIPYKRGAVTLVLDPSAAPPMRPTVDPGFEKSITKGFFYDNLTGAEKQQYEDLSNQYTKLVSAGNVGSPEYDAVVKAHQDLVDKGYSRIPSRPNPNYEFESRTNNQSIPAKAIKSVITTSPGAYARMNQALAGKTVGLTQIPESVRPLYNVGQATPTMTQLIPRLGVSDPAAGASAQLTLMDLVKRLTGQ